MPAHAATVLFDRRCRPAGREEDSRARGRAAAAAPAGSTGRLTSSGNHRDKTSVPWSARMIVPSRGDVVPACCSPPKTQDTNPGEICSALVPQTGAPERISVRIIRIRINPCALLVISTVGHHALSCHLDRRPPSPSCHLGRRPPTFSCPLGRRPPSPSCHLDRRPPSPSCHLDRRPPSPSCHLDRRPQAGVERSGYERAVSGVCAKVRRPGQESSGREAGSHIRLRNIRDQMSRLRCAALDMTRGTSRSVRHDRPCGNSCRMRRRCPLLPHEAQTLSRRVSTLS
jgi:hypothetical protein